MPPVDSRLLPPAPAQIRAAREELDLTQAQAAGLLYRTARNWQQWELGERKMDLALWELFQLKTAGAIASPDDSKN